MEALLIQLVVFNVGAYVVQILFGLKPFPIKSLLGNLLPNNYFIILYCTLYLISPYINRAVNNLDIRQHRNFVGLCALLFPAPNFT